ncbi:hypothetical protein BIHU0010003c01_00034 [Bifidobacterium phage BitterVaud1]|nr:hypothetical protein BIHU0010003c01_00034 [Bifidobacterium phage BitterVaud1]
MLKFMNINKKFDDEITKTLERLADVIDTMRASDDDQDESNQIRIAYTDHRVIQQDGQETNNLDEQFKTEDSVEFERLTKLMDLKNAYNEDRQETIQTLIKAGVTLTGIIVLLSFERENVITSKALSFIPKTNI